jgi:hypothetical protein
MSLIDMTQFDRIGPYTDRDSRTYGRNEACEGVESELASRRSALDESAVAVRRFGEGSVVVGITGPVDRPTARRIGVLLRSLRPFSTRELVLTFVLLGPWDPQLARVIGQARVHHLIDGGRLDLHHAPTEMFTAVGAPAA